MASKVQKYPSGLFYLVFTEFWERFGYYLMIGIFTLYMIKPEEEGGWGWDNSTAADIYGSFIAFVYLTPFMGGILADLKLGYRLSIVLGGILMGVGYILLGIHEKWAFYTSLFLMVLGNGFFKPNISTLLGNLYNQPDFKDKKDYGYNIFYMGINAGALVCNFVAAFMRNKFGWQWAFTSAGIGMFAGVIIFLMGNKYYKDYDKRRTPSHEELNRLKQFFLTVGLALMVALLGWFMPGNIMGSDSTDAFFFACIPVIAFFLNIYRQLKTEKDKMNVQTMYIIFLVVILFWAVFKQNGSALTTYAEYYTDRQISPAVAKMLEPVELVEKLKAENKERPQVDEHFRKIKNEKGEVVKCIDYPLYFKNLNANEYPPEGGQLLLINTELFQSVNPFFVLLFTPLVIGFFSHMKKMGKEPTTAGKIALGLFISALSVLVMVGAVYASNNGSDKASAWWLVLSYAVITIGELCLSPMGLSMVSKLAPAGMTALMMGGWSLATSIGNKLSGVLSKNWDLFDNKANYFWLNFFLLMFAFFIMFALLKKLNKVFDQ
jgi:POT family proton-dependent oligopeptide transporter